MNTEQINTKNKLIDDAIVQLKKEFIGIDYQIDCVMDNLRTWFLFPELQERPLIINLWGMSGCGKTALVRRISQLLDIEDDYTYFNFAAIEEMSSWEIEDKLNDELSNDKSNRLFVYDEFQHAATINEHGEEKEKKGCLKTFWELLDTGILHMKDSYAYKKNFYHMLRYLTMIDNTVRIQLNDKGEWVNSVECLSQFTDYEVVLFTGYFNAERGESDALLEPEDTGTLLPKRRRFIIRDHEVEKMFDAYRRKHGETDKVDFYNMLYSMTVEGLKALLTELSQIQSKGYSLDFKDSVVFVIGNLDEAYKVSYDVNPDMSPDQFHAITKKLSIVDIKEALQKRFRNEQIARLGNIHVIYPSMSSDTFKKIITLELDKYVHKTKEETGYTIRYDDKIVQHIYNEGVFPTHGTRPVFSTIQEVVKSKLPFAIKDVVVDGLTIDTISYSYSRGYTYAEVFYEGKKVGKYKFKEKLRVENLRVSKKDDRQALVAVHESGHFVMYAKLKHSLPKTVKSVTTDSHSDGYLMYDDIEDEKIQSAQEILTNIKIALGGYVAEELIFGREHLTVGSANDLRKATVMASKYVREYCLGKFGFISTYTTGLETSSGGHIINDEQNQEVSDEIKSILNSCWNEVRATLRQHEWLKMLKASAKYLSEHSTLTQAKMRECYDLVSDKTKGVENEKDYYRNIVSKF